MKHANSHLFITVSNTTLASIIISIGLGVTLKTAIRIKRPVNQIVQEISIVRFILIYLQKTPKSLDINKLVLIQKQLAQVYPFDFKGKFVVT